MSESDVTFYDASAVRNESLEAEALTQLIRSLQPLPSEARQRVLASVAVFFGLSGQPLVRAQQSTPQPISPGRGPQFSEERAPSPKEFLFEKRPQTDVERVACLAYYMAHYLNTPHFKTLDLSKLNTDAAQLKFANTANAVENATKAGLLVQASKGSKQISALGELYVQSLPDRDAAREAVAHARKPRRKTKKSTKDSQDDTDTNSGSNEE